MEDMDVSTCVVDKKTSEEELLTVMSEFRKILSAGKSVAFVICKGALTDAPQVEYKNDYSISREDTIRHIVSVSGEDSIVSTTGKGSRELFEIREANGDSHKYDFLTVGSMRHASSIALGVAFNKTDKKIWCYGVYRW